MPVTATVITLNEARHIEACLASLAWADERIVVDSGSTDDTVALARKARARVIEHPWPGYAAGRPRTSAGSRLDADRSQEGATEKQESPWIV